MNEQKTEFETAGENDEFSLGQEFYHFVAENQKWWLIPILLVFAVVGLFLVLASTGAAPFIYTLF